MKWETVEQDHGMSMFRAPVFGGWMVMVTNEVKTQVPEAWSQAVPSFRNEEGYEWRSSITFMPDPEHRWDLKTEYGPFKFK